METTIRIRIKKELSSQQEKYILQLKGAIIARKYTEIIHIGDEDETSYINYFKSPITSKEEAVLFINTYIQENNISAVASMLA